MTTKITSALANKMIALDLVENNFEVGYASREQARNVAKALKEAAESAGVQVKAKTPVKGDNGWKIPGLSFGKTLSLHK